MIRFPDMISKGALIIQGLNDRTAQRSDGLLLQWVDVYRALVRKVCDALVSQVECLLTGDPRADRVHDRALSFQVEIREEERDVRDHLQTAE